MMILSACAPAAAATPQTVEVTRIVAGTPVVQVITATPAATPTRRAHLAAGRLGADQRRRALPSPCRSTPNGPYAYQYVDPAVAINYQGIGSGGGKKAIIDGTVDFAGSDSLVSDAEYTSGKDLQMLPAVAGAAVADL